MRTTAISLLFCFLLACGNPSTAVTPTPVQQSADSQIAAWLLTAQTAITQAEPLVATNPGLKDPLNRVIAAYNTAESAYLVYHAAVKAGTSADATALTAQVTQLLSNVTAMVSLYGGKP
jgi:hypothetical protein